MAIALHQIANPRQESTQVATVISDVGALTVWAKGGRGRSVPVETAAQRELLDRIRGLVGNGALIPRAFNYAQQLKLYEHQTLAAGLRTTYGLRHAWAQERYRQLTGWAAPAAGGTDVAASAVAAVRRWLDQMGRERYPNASELTITADGGGSNGSRVRLWKIELQKFADTTGLTIHVHHYPPGTSKWNKIEHRMFCHITQTWRGRPLTDRLAVVELIGATTTKTGLKVECALDERTYEKGIKVSDAEMATLDIEGDVFHPEWNYTIRPRSAPPNRSG